MKILIIAMVLFSAGFVFPQVQDSVQTRKGKQEQAGPMMDKKMKTEVREEEQGLRRKKDVFIDKDGDGICDTRQGGMSFGRMRQRMGEGKKGPDGSGMQNRYGGGRK